MIRPAKMTDIPRLVDILKDAHSRSVYAGKVGVDERQARGLLAEAVMASFNSAAFAKVSERAGQIEGFLIGITAPLYLIGDRLMATDLFWIATAQVEPRDPRQLMADFIAWAKANPLVFEVRCGTTPVIQAPEKAARILKRLGMNEYGQFHRLEV